MSWVTKLGFAVVYTLGYFVLAFGAAGAGHGTFVFVAPVFTWVLVVIAIYFSTNADTLLKRVFFVLCLLIHYAHILIFLRPLFLGEIDPGTANTWKLTNGPAMMVFITGWYLVGQFVIWWMFLRAAKKTK